MFNFLQKSMKKIICLGSATRDLTFGAEIDDQMPGKICLPAGEKLYADDFQETVGGGAVNVGAGLTKLGYRCFVFARTDRSWTGKWIQKQIGKLKLKKNYLQQNGREPSETCAILADYQEQDRVILRAGDSVDNFDVAKACRRFKERVDWIYISSQKKNHLRNLEVIIEFARNKKAKIALNPSGYQIKHDADQLLSMLSEIDVLFLNLEEAVFLLQEEINTYWQDNKPVEEKVPVLLDRFLETGVKIIALTAGAYGAWVAAKIKGETVVYFLRGEKVENVVDTTGAGDAFTAGFLGMFIKLEDDLEMRFAEKIQEALAAGIANSSNVIQAVGAVNGLLKPSRLHRKSRELSKEIQEII